ncbi:unnamed protein product [Clonostachys byssicola]|uniref:Uncharacterized protein n=1 Tax=Clonostachys byssicola TaxID=160290 RepID=A0A9N9UF31_9HYPO|nr:unnamed protein product [Clonostachys byssicola]
MVTFTSPSGPVPAKNSYRKELARLRQSKPLSKVLVHECVKSLLPQEPVYIVAVRYWSSLNQKDQSYLAKALGPDEDFLYIDEHLNLAMERTESGRIDFNFEELVSVGVLKPLNAHTDSNDSMSSNDSANSDDAANSDDSTSGDAAVKEASGEIHSNLYYHHPFQFPPGPPSFHFHPGPPSFQFAPGPPPLGTNLAPPPISWDAAPSPPSSNSDLPEASPDKAPAGGNFFGQKKQAALWKSSSSVSAENPGKTETVAS